MRALISIGTNSTRLLVLDGRRVVVHDVRGTRIGAGIHERGPIDGRAAQRTLAAVEAFARVAREHGASTAGIATSALRRAANSGVFCEAFERIAGAPLRILSGDEEARYSFLGAVRGLERTGPTGVLDVGGGSSEYAYGDERGATSAVSCEIGAVRLTELVEELHGTAGPVADAALERARRLARQALEPLAGMPRPKALVVVGGSAFAAGALVLGAEREALSGRTLTASDLDGLLGRLCSLDLEGRKRVPGMIEQRADILPGGIIVLREAMAQLGSREVTLSAADLLYGYLTAQPPNGDAGP